MPSKEKLRIPSVLEEYFGKSLKELLTELHHDKGLHLRGILKELNNALEQLSYPERIGDERVINSWMRKRGVEKLPFDRSSFMSEENKKRWSNDDYKDRLSKKMKETWDNNDEFREACFAGLKRSWSNEKNRKIWSDNAKKNLASEENKRRTSERLKKAWNDPEYRKSMLERASKSKGNSIEIKVMQILEEIGVKYSFNDMTVLEGETFFPDFLIGETKVIEVQGDYWHANPEKYDYETLNDIQKTNVQRDKKKHKLYSENGYSVLYVWERDIKRNYTKVLELITAFTRA